jgi:hypothetical protein
MRGPFIRALTWGFRLLSIAIAFWWPAVFRDPIYTPREARLTGHELQLPALPSLETPSDIQAFSIFWHWEHRTLVKTRWLLGPCRGLRDAEGRQQTLIVLFIFWAVSSLLLSRWTPRSPLPAEASRRGITTFLATPLWQWFARR